MNRDKPLRMLTTKDTIDQIVSCDGNAAHLLNSIGLNPDHYQGRSLQSVCFELQWNEEELLSWIKKHYSEAECPTNHQEEPDCDDDIVTWCNWLEDSLNLCICSLANDIARDLPWVHQIHGNQYTGLKSIAWQFNSLKKHLERYLALEKETLFPLAKELNFQKESILYGKARKLERSMDVLDEDRPKIAGAMKKLRDISDGFSHPAGSCTTLRITNKNLSDLDRQLNGYFRVEEEQLWPLIKHQLQTA